jgi:hypothetical protein
MRQLFGKDDTRSAALCMVGILADLEASEGPSMEQRVGVLSSLGWALNSGPE